jgi:hypothetical protein
LYPDKLSELSDPLLEAKCTSKTCLVREEKIQQQEEQIQMLKYNVQQYKDRLQRYSTSQNDQISSVEHEETDFGTAMTTHKEKTYADMIGPWVPLHVEIPSDDESDEESEITFAQHPCKMSESFLGSRRCLVDDDGALPLTRLNRDEEGRSTYTGKPLQRNNTKTSSRSPKTNNRRKLPRANVENPEKRILSNGLDDRVQRMRVVVERKYCRQKALYSGMLHPQSGCPHGVGTLQFIESGDRYIGEVEYGEMHGKGSYYFSKRRKIFRGNFVHNTFIGEEK